jgi:hypothetical protein
VIVGEQIVGERGAEMNKNQPYICLIRCVPLSKRSIVIWIWTNSELSQSLSKPVSSAGNPLEDLSAGNSLIQLELEMTRCP